ncbi:MAG: MotA/TolQ/ExbB proton channel family protein [Gemmatimonadetes bacterium]|nr:MotA/TolQ/ExbB proton channel family protein [Gemmatimonadota bacterium]NIQ54138.1 MotA/TolQ/ExbB proton channel family protein [Gemmatimonadota bacterium]NIU74337.1 MotA/TolQ/ExbB proton channel family protein [Gammaproteobacteria bacterium]NIX44346.1 MotA/TolQ/ExbB proton channel family protein [Gemmatimonadota bacterium]NIY08562.1 MotA/TolQ/ExbB proton channel family protein [Gemmatimonadota bacterium]
MSGVTFLNLALQIPGMEGPDLTVTEWMVQIWEDGGFMMWPLGAALAIGIGVIIWKLIDLSITSSRTKKVLREVDERLAARDVKGAMEAARESDTPAGQILLAGLERHDEGSERVMKAIENVGLIQMAGLENGLVWIATIANVAPLLGFLGTVIGMIQAFQNIEAAGEVEATLVAGGIKVALITTASGLAIAIPMNIMHNYFVTKVDRLVIDMEESAQKMIDTLQEIEAGATA